MHKFAPQVTTLFDPDLAFTKPGSDNFDLPLHAKRMDFYINFLSLALSPADVQKILEALYDLASKENCDSVLQLFTSRIGLHSDLFRNQHIFATTPDTLGRGGIGERMMNDMMDGHRDALSGLSRQMDLFPGLKTDFELYFHEQSRKSARKIESFPLRPRPKPRDFH